MKMEKNATSIGTRWSTPEPTRRLSSGKSTSPLTVENYLKIWCKVSHETFSRSEECDIYRDALVYAGTNQKTKQWEVNITTHGGKLFENLVQGIARDILAAKLLKFEDAGMPVVGHVHDEGITLVVDDCLSPTVHDMVEIMSVEESWAPGLLLGADGFEGEYYHK